MKRFQQFTLIVVAFICLYIAYERYFISHYGWRSPATLVALSIVLVFQIWELERPEKELTTNELMEEMKQNKTLKSKWNFQHLWNILWWLGILVFSIWMGYSMLIMGVVACIFFLLVRIAIQHYEEAQKEDEIAQLIQKIDELKGKEKP